MCETRDRDIIGLGRIFVLWYRDALSQTTWVITQKSTPLSSVQLISAVNMQSLILIYILSYPQEARGDIIVPIAPIFVLVKNGERDKTENA